MSLHLQPLDLLSINYSTLINSWEAIRLAHRCHHVLTGCIDQKSYLILTRYSLDHGQLHLDSLTRISISQRLTTRALPALIIERYTLPKSPRLLSLMRGFSQYPNTRRRRHRPKKKIKMTHTLVCKITLVLTALPPRVDHL